MHNTWNLCGRAKKFHLQMRLLILCDASRTECEMFRFWECEAIKSRSQICLSGFRKLRTHPYEPQSSVRIGSIGGLGNFNAPNTMNPTTRIDTMAPLIAPFALIRRQSIPVVKRPNNVPDGIPDIVVAIWKIWPAFSTWNTNAVMTIPRTRTINWKMA